MAPAEAMFHAVEQQMRPMLMTALSACIGLLPAAISTGIGSQVQRPLATVVVGGMFIGPIMLLVVVPALQTLFLDRADRASSAGEPEAPRNRPSERSMAKERNLRIGLYLLAAVLLGTPAMQASFARSNRAPTRPRGRALRSAGRLSASVRR